MKNWIKGWLQRRRERKASRRNIKYLESLAQQHQWLDQLKKAGLLHWDVVQRRLFIEADLAVLFMQDAMNVCVSRWPADARALTLMNCWRLRRQTGFTKKLRMRFLYINR